MICIVACIICKLRVLFPVYFFVETFIYMHKQIIIVRIVYRYKYASETGIGSYLRKVKTKPHSLFNNDR